MTVTHPTICVAKPWLTSLIALQAFFLIQYDIDLGYTRPVTSEEAYPADSKSIFCASVCSAKDSQGNTLWMERYIAIVVFIYSIVRYLEMLDTAC